MSLLQPGPNKFIPLDWKCINLNECYYAPELHSLKSCPMPETVPRKWEMVWHVFSGVKEIQENQI